MVRTGGGRAPGLVCAYTRPCPPAPYLGKAAYLPLDMHVRYCPGEPGRDDVRRLFLFFSLFPLSILSLSFLSASFNVFRSLLHRRLFSRIFDLVKPIRIKSYYSDDGDTME